MEAMTTREEIIETINKLFIYTDYREWEKLQSEVFTKKVHLDMSSMGADPANTTAKKICRQWEEGFRGLDAVNHLAGNYLVTFDGDQAKVFAYATATHYRESAIKGKTREFVGSYDFHLVKTEEGWRIDRFKYSLKYTGGNMTLE
jgi:hypothetical protein